MPDASGTPTSPDNIPTYNTALDPPSGKGFNTAIAAIQAALTNNYTRKPSGLVSGEVPVWNGTTWVRSSVTNIGPTSLGSGTPDSTKFLRGDGAWTAVTGPSFIQKITTQKNVGSSVTQTDLFNGAVTLPALTATSIVRVKAWGLWVNSTGSTQSTPVFQPILNGVGLPAISSLLTVWTSGAGSLGWVCEFVIENLGATNSQQNNVELRGTITGGGQASTNTGGYVYSPAAIGGASTLYGQAAGSSAIDTSVGRALQLGVTNAVNSASYATALNGAIIEVF